MKEEVLRVSQSSVAQALAADYFCIYYVNVDNNKFIEYSASPEYRALGLPSSGDDILAFARSHFDDIVYPDDRAQFLDSFTKEHILEAMAAHGTFTMTFRLMFGENPTYVHLKATRMIEREGHHVVIGISSVDEQMRAREAFEHAHHERITYGRVAQALAKDFFSIYVVDPDTDRFVEYSSDTRYDELGIEKSGEHFFDLSRKNMARVIYPEDRDRFMGTFYKEKVMSILERDGSFTMKYRLMFGDEPVYVSMKASLLEDEHGRHLIIGTNNIDAQIKREQEYQARMASARTQAKNDFLANMSHDIRTPMNAIVGYTNIAKSNWDNPDTVKDALDKIGSSSHFLLSLINDILDISKIESGKMRLSYGPCDLGALFGRIEDITALQARDKSLNISYNHDGVRHYHVCADELRIEQVLINIVSNAIKYTPEGRSVSLLAEEEPGQDGTCLYRFVVSDTGIGISEEYLPHLFESFTREERTTVNRVQGTGLGLAITARVVEQMGGSISVKSKLGEGSTFTVELALEALDEEPKAGPAPDEAQDLSGRQVLLVEDHDINAQIATMILEQSGLVVTRAENGRQAVELVGEAGDAQFDAVLMDIQMPVMDGYEATRAIRALGGRACELPIVAMSANAYDEDVQACLDAGMNAHMAKPFKPEELLAQLGRWIAS